MEVNWITDIQFSIPTGLPSMFYVCPFSLTAFVYHQLSLSEHCCLGCVCVKSNCRTAHNEHLAHLLL